MKRYTLAICILAGLLLGLGAFTFTYAEGFSYFSHDPKACANCHVMNEFYDSWQKGSHHNAGVCVDCHMPQKFFEKIVAKADNGYRHSKGFTFMDFHDPITIKPRNSAILQQNCLRCHGALVHEIIGGEREAEQVSCVRCHSHVGHGPQR